jgi:hypothetical protein
VFRLAVYLDPSCLSSLLFFDVRTGIVLDRWEPNWYQVHSYVRIKYLTGRDTIMKRERTQHSLVYAGDGRDPIDIVPYLFYEQEESASFCSVVAVVVSVSVSCLSKDSILCVGSLLSVANILLLFYCTSVLVSRFQSSVSTLL